MEEAKVHPELLLLVFVHGFKGSDNTFSDFPQRLEHNLTKSILDIKVESVVFPAYEVGYRAENIFRILLIYADKRRIGKHIKTPPMTVSHSVVCSRG
jgi:hypothetical protein